MLIFLMTLSTVRPGEKCTTIIAPEQGPIFMSHYIVFSQKLLYTHWTAIVIHPLRLQNSDQMIFYYYLYNLYRVPIVLWVIK
jgi:hypothetical protein